MGFKGFVYMFKDELYEFKVYKIKIVDIIGVGDVYIGVFVYGLVMYEFIIICLKIVLVVGVYVCLKEGVEDVMGIYSDIEKLMEELK